MSGHTVPRADGRSSASYHARLRMTQQQRDQRNIALGQLLQNRPQLRPATQPRFTRGQAVTIRSCLPWATQATGHIESMKFTPYGWMYWVRHRTERLVLAEAALLERNPPCTALMIRPQMALAIVT